MRSLLLTMAFALSFGTFRYFPGFLALREVWVFVLLFALVYIAFRRLMKFTGYECYLLFLFLFIPSVASIRASQVFGQPVWIGLLQQRGMATILVSLLLIHAYQTKLISFEEIRSGFIYYAWGCLALFAGMEIILNPVSFAHITGFVAGGVAEPFGFVFDTVPLSLGYFYYLTSIVRGRRLSETLTAVIFALVFLGFIVFVQGGRSFFISTIIVTLAYIFLKSTLTTLVGWGVAALFVLIGAYLFPDNLLMEGISNYSERLSQAIQVVTTGEYGEDASSNARIDEIRIAMPYLIENWLMGSGSISVQWNGGWDGVVGALRPTDIGIIGNIFVVGLVGTAALYVQFAFALRYIRVISRRKLGSAFTSSLALWLFGVVMHSLTTGKLLYYPAVSLAFITVLYLSSRISVTGAR